MRGVLSATGEPPAALVEKARAVPSMAGLDLATRVYHQSLLHLGQAGGSLSPSEILEPAAEECCHVVAYDFGIKRNILRRLATWAPTSLSYRPAHPPRTSSR